ncbi:hypothetical protein PFISCL1PPCAC_18871, partial [Pristionchus fissidentatus]
MVRSDPSAQLLTSIPSTHVTVGEVPEEVVEEQVEREQERGQETVTDELRETALPAQEVPNQSPPMQTTLSKASFPVEIYAVLQLSLCWFLAVHPDWTWPELSVNVHWSQA